MAPSELDTDKLLRLHELTREFSQVSLLRLRGHLEALAPLFRPRRFLGDHMEGAGKEVAAGTEKNFADLVELYRSVAVKPFDLRPELQTPLESVPTSFQLHEWEYLHPTLTDRGWQSIRVMTPLAWVVVFASPYSFSTLRDVVGGNAPRDPEAVRSFVLRACIVHELFRKTPSLKELLTALRYQVEVRKSASFGELPLVVVSAPFQTFRPPDALVALASGLAGGQMFAEVIDVESLRGLSDPLRVEGMRLLERHHVD